MHELEQVLIVSNVPTIILFGTVLHGGTIGVMETMDFITLAVSIF
jgi:hypothetical protein